MAMLDNTIAAGGGPNPQFDEQIENGGFSVIQAINAYRDESEQARNQRISQFDRNWDTYLGRQSWAHKLPGQSKEFLPKSPLATEKLTFIVKRGLMQFGDYFSVKLDYELEEKISPEQVREILKPFLNDLWGTENESQKFPTIMSDAVKQALHKSLVILKVHGGDMTKRQFTYQNGEQLKVEDFDEWHLRIDVVRVEDYYPDPTGNGLYEIHRVERDFHQIMNGVDNGIYDRATVEQMIMEDYERPDDEKLSDEDRNQQESTAPSFRRRVVLDEFWGTLLNSDGSVAHRNVVATVANGKYLIRPPEPNPFWHQESPFVVAPLVRIPFSVWHKAIFDHASDLNLAINELFNLIIDGGIASVWGIKQLRIEDLEDPSQVENGIQQGTTLAVKQTLPHNAKVLETVAEADIPREAMSVFEYLNREFDAASMSDGMGRGSIPPVSSDTPAVAFLQASQSQNIMLDGIIGDLEHEVMSRVLRKSFMVVLQNADAIPDTSFGNVYDKKVALALMRASPEERFAMFASRTKFEVFGLSSLMTLALDFQKFMAMLQAVSIDPTLKAEFMLEYSPRRIIQRMMRMLNINPDDLRKTAEELKQALQNPTGPFAQASAMNSMLGKGPRTNSGQAAGIAGGPGTGGSATTASIQQQSANPAAGIPNS